MVLDKRIYYGFNGHQVPTMPRTRRSIRKSGSFWKKIDGNQVCAFDLLATVAGKLLSEEERSPSSTDAFSREEKVVGLKDSVKNENIIDSVLDTQKPNPTQSLQNLSDVLEIKTCDQETHNNANVSEHVSQASSLDQSLEGLVNVSNDICSRYASVITTSECPEKDKLLGKSIKVENGLKLGCFISDVDVDVGSSSYVISSVPRLEDENKNDVNSDAPNNENASIHGIDACSSKDPLVCDERSAAVLDVENSVKSPICPGQIASNIYPKCRDELKVVFKDDDENSSGRIQPRVENKAYRLPPRFGERRIRKLLSSKYWKITSKSKVEDRFTTGAEIMPIYHNRRTCFKRQRSQRDYPFKKRKRYRYSSVSNSDGGISRDGISGASCKTFNDSAYRPGTEVNRATGMPVSGPGQRCLQSRDSSVKLKIKSFRVPELLIEIPETATVGSLKRAVMEAVTSILGGGLRVGVLLQGKNIRDDHKTLQQSGICHDDRLDSLGFTLEPTPPPESQPYSECCPYLLPCDVSQPLSRYPPGQSAVDVVHPGAPDALTDTRIMDVSNAIGMDHHSVPSAIELSTEKVTTTESRALVTVPAIKVEALTVVPMRKSKQSEAVQRRIRRPFSVSEVEALVQAVEKLGTGRWRDVKMRAFDNAKHRTYVDLKDKWKTLVHTARISPQQRRGEPVPQELLDRVLAVHAYWSQQQSKQHHKQQAPEACLH